MTKHGVPEEAWKTWREFNSTIQGRSVVFFGCADDWFAKTFKYSSPEVVFVVDNGKSMIGQRFLDWEVHHPDTIRRPESDAYVVITSGSYDSIVPQLLEYGLTPGRDFCISPALNNLRVIADIHSHEARLLVSSPDHKIYGELDRDSDVGGGLYVYDIQERQARKVLEGIFHQIVDAGDVYYIAEEQRGICVVSKDFKLLDSFGAIENDAPHGVAWCPDRNLVCLSRTRMDRVAGFNAETREPVFEIELSDKRRRLGYSHHWINDLCIKDGFLYVSMFSQSGTYPNGVFDGGILQVDLEDTDKRRVLINSAWMPHTVRFFDSDLCYLDSMRGHFYKTDKRIVGEFHGFMRGLAYDGSYYYVGQSETRYFDRLRGVRKHIAMNAGFYLFDEDTKAAKYFSFDSIRQVHDLCVIRPS